MAGIHEVARAASITDTQARTLFQSILDFVSKDDTNGKPNRVFIKGFGTFKRVTMKARTIISPQIPSGSAEVPEQDVLRFKASPTTKPLLNAATPKPAAKKAKPAAAAKPTPAAKPAPAPAAKPAKPAKAAAPKKAKPEPAPAPEPEPEVETEEETEAEDSETYTEE